MAAAAGEVKKGVDAGEVKKFTQGDWVMKAMLGAVKENLTDEKNDVNENLTEKNDVNESLARRAHGEEPRHGNISKRSKQATAWEEALDQEAEENEARLLKCVLTAAKSPVSQDPEYVKLSAKSAAKLTPAVVPVVVQTGCRCRQWRWRQSVWIPCENPIGEAPGACSACLAIISHKHQVAALCSSRRSRLLPHISRV
jgi:hypothetical protein